MLYDLMTRLFFSTNCILIILGRFMLHRMPDVLSVQTWPYASYAQVGLVHSALIQ